MTSEQPTRDGVELLVLDVNGVLYRYDKPRRIEVLGEDLGRSSEEIDRALFGSGLEDAADAGELGPEEYLEAVGRRLGVQLDRETWRRALAAAVVPVEDVLDLVSGLGGRVPMVTLSNNGLLVAEEFAEIYPRIVELGIEVHVAAQFGASKPDRDVYVDVCETHGVAPAAAAFVDDKQENVDGARAAGLRAHRFRGATDLADFFDDIGLAR